VLLFIRFLCPQLFFCPACPTAASASLLLTLALYSLCSISVHARPLEPWATRLLRLNGRNSVGTRGTCPPHFFRRGNIICHVPPLFSLRFCISRGFKNKSDVCHVLCEEFFMLDGRPHIAKLMLKQILVWYH